MKKMKEGKTGMLSGHKEPRVRILQFPTFLERAVFNTFLPDLKANRFPIPPIDADLRGRRNKKS